MILRRIDKIPIELVIIIKSYIPREIIIVTNKKECEGEYMKLRLTQIGNLHSYSRKIIINKLNYIFEMLIKFKYTHWKNIKRYRYNGYKYDSYILFLEQLCIMLESTKCGKVIGEFEKRNGIVRKKKHKKMRSINNTWTN
jgi:hypothetical protein